MVAFTVKNSSRLESTRTYYSSIPFAIKNQTKRVVKEREMERAKSKNKTQNSSPGGNITVFIFAVFLRADQE